MRASTTRHNDRQRPTRLRAGVGRIGLTLTMAVLCSCTPPRATLESAPAADPTTVRVTRAGTVIGTQGRYGGAAWLGIPYARPPVGELRWRAPQPPEPWAGTRAAVSFGAPCMQIAHPFGGIDGATPGHVVGSEDCLYLNVWSPAFSAGHVPAGSEALPVMLWIHGGSNSVGHGGFYDGSNLATTHRVIVLSVNYRLGPFGWFRHPALRANGSDADRSGNFGILDLIRALQWVRDNIAAFGGDPGKVTIFGESAGGTDVVMLLVSPLTGGLFHRAIVESGGTRTTALEVGENFVDDPVRGHPNSSREILLRLLQRDGLAGDRTAAKARLAGMSDVEVANYLRTKSGADVLSAYVTESFEGLIDLPALFRDGYVLPREAPFGLLGLKGGYHAVPVMLGTNRDEVKLFMSFNPKLVRRWFGIIPTLRNRAQYEVIAHYGSEVWKAQAADGLAARMREVQGPSVYVYRFDWDEEPKILWSDLSVILGAAHAFEIPFVFGHFDLGREGNRIFTSANEPGRKALSATMMSYWAQFASAGDPGTGHNGELVSWTAWDNAAAAPKYLVLDTPADGGLRMSSVPVTTASIVAEIDADPRLPTQRDKCERFRDLTLRMDDFTGQDYVTAGARGCAAYPLAAYPWRD